MKKIIINGATGMIGLNLTKYALNNGIEVLAIIRENSNKKELFPKNEKLKVVECDLENINKLEILDNYDVFYHLAWAGTFGEDRNNVYMQNLNIRYALDSVNLAKKAGCKKFIGTGSQAEYGRKEEKLGPQTATNPETAYGVGKLCAGRLTNIFAKKLEIEHIWTRILSVYGPYDNEKTMIMSSIKEMMHNQNSPEYTKAEQLWDYIYVEDVAKALYLIGEKGKNNSIYCIGSGNAKPLYSYIEEIRNQINKSIEIKLGARAYEQNQVMYLCADIENLTKDTGFVPKIDFEEGIKRTINWYKRRNEK